MTTYLCIITTALVVTQIIRITQNAINLHRQNAEIKKTISWIKDMDVSERDFNCQREVFYLLRDWLRDWLKKETEHEEDRD